MFVRDSPKCWAFCGMFVRDSPNFWAVLQLLGPDFDMVLGVLGGFTGVILIARRKSPGRKLAKTHASLQNRPEVALASFGLGKSPLRILPDRHLRIRQSPLAD